MSVEEAVAAEIMKIPDVDQGISYGEIGSVIKKLHGQYEEQDIREAWERIWRSPDLRKQLGLKRLLAG